MVAPLFSFFWPSSSSVGRFSPFSFFFTVFFRPTATLFAIRPPLLPFFPFSYFALLFNNRAKIAHLQLPRPIAPVCAALLLPAQINTSHRTQLTRYSRPLSYFFFFFASCPSRRSLRLFSTLLSPLFSSFFFSLFSFPFPSCRALTFFFLRQAVSSLPAARPNAPCSALVHRVERARDFAAAANILPAWPKLIPALVSRHLAALLPHRSLETYPATNTPLRANPRSPPSRGSSVVALEWPLLRHTALFDSANPSPRT